jgi:hypothetical protein
MRPPRCPRRSTARRLREVLAAGLTAAWSSAASRPATRPGRTASGCISPTDGGPRRTCCHRRGDRHGDRAGPLPGTAGAGRAVALAGRGLPDVGGGGGPRAVRRHGQAAGRYVAGRAARADLQADQDLASGPARAARAGRRGRDVPGQDLHLTPGSALAAEPGHRTRRRHPRDEPGARFGGQHRAAGRGAALPHADRARGKGARRAQRRTNQGRTSRSRTNQRRANPGRTDQRRRDRGRRRVRKADARRRLRCRRRLQPSGGQDRHAAQPAHVLAVPPDDRPAADAVRPDAGPPEPNA